jgi:tetratricopeptide (TPR) repeat protein
VIRPKAAAIFSAILFLAAAWNVAAVPSALDYYQRGLAAATAEDWYGAAEAFLESLRLNPTYSGPTAALAECYYQLGEFDQALTWVRRARALNRGDAALANLEAFILTALGRLDEADAVIRDVLAREPYNKEAVFAAAELDLARGKTGDALARYREGARRYPDDRRALLSLALVLDSLGDRAGARGFADKALAAHPDDPRVLYYAAYLDASSGDLAAAAGRLVSALGIDPGYGPARSLLATVRYRAGQYEDAAALADAVIASDRSDFSAWYLKGLAYQRLGRSAEARGVLAGALAIAPDDEFARAALEMNLIANTPVESAERARWAAFHFTLAADYRTRNLADQALFEYRRGLRIDPYSKERATYAELLRVSGYPERQLAELRFLQDIGRTDRSINDAIETYDSLLADSLDRRWSVDPLDLASRHWKVAVVSLAGQASARHVDSGLVAASLARDLLVHEGNVSLVDIPVEQPSFSAAFRAARSAGADYFLMVATAENDRDLSIDAELFVARTGSAAAGFTSFRTGADRLRGAARKIVEALAAALPFRGELVVRRAGQALIDKGRADGVAQAAKYAIVRKSDVEPLPEGIGLSYPAAAVLGTITIDEVDEMVASGTLSRTGFFDRISVGDAVISLAPPDVAKPAAAEPTVDPELRQLLRNLR